LVSGYELERTDRPGLAVDPNSTLDSQGTMDFKLVNNTGILYMYDIIMNVISMY